MAVIALFRQFIKYAADMTGFAIEDSMCAFQGKAGGQVVKSGSWFFFGCCRVNRIGEDKDKQQKRRASQAISPTPARITAKFTSHISYGRHLQTTLPALLRELKVLGYKRNTAYAVIAFLNLTVQTAIQALLFY